MTSGTNSMWKFSARGSGAGQPNEIQKQDTLNFPNRQCFLNNQGMWHPQHMKKQREFVTGEQPASLSWNCSTDQKLSLYLSSGSGSQCRANWILRFVWKAFISSSWYNYRAWMLCSPGGMGQLGMGQLPATPAWAAWLPLDCIQDLKISHAVKGTNKAS